MTLNDTERHIIHLVPWMSPLDAASSPGQAPETLRLPRRMGTAGRIWFALLSTLMTVGAALAIFALWTNETPGLWFNLIFTAMSGALAIVPWAILMNLIGRANLEQHWQAVWRGIAATAVVTTGRVAERNWVLAEDGSVISFALGVKTSDGRSIQGEWYPPNARTCLLQSQVPGIGSEARVWHAPDASATLPLVIEVADPSVVA